MDKATREMSFEEEAKLYEEEACAEFAKESGYGDIEGVNTILRRGMRIVQKAREEIAHGVTVQEWISVEDRLPEKSGYYLVAVDIAYMSVVQYSAKHKAFNAWDGFDDARHSIDVTHWMPLPEPPKGE